MDVTLPFPGSWSLVKKNLPSLIGAGIGAIASSYASGRRAYKQLESERKSAPFATSTTSRTSARQPTMPTRAYRTARRVRRRMMRRPRFSKGMTTNAVKRFVRSSTLFTVGLSASSTVFQSSNITLSNVQVSDLTPIYRLFRIRKVVLHLVPRVDPGNSGLVNNFQCMIAAACDPESTAAPTNITQVTAYDNSYQKLLTAGEKFTYTFYPKVTNTIDVSGAATAAGSYATNPWVRLDATGITVPHLSIKLGIQSAVTTMNFDYYYDLHFDTRGIA